MAKRNDMPVSKGNFHKPNNMERIAPVTSPKMFSEEAITKEELKDDYENSVEVVVANCAKVNVRKSGDMKAEVLFEAPAGTEFLAESFSGEWLHVYLFDHPQKDGYIMRVFTKEVK